MDSWRVVRLKFFSKNSKCILFSKIKKVPPTWKEQAKIYKRRLWRSASSLIIGILLTLAICISVYPYTYCPYKILGFPKHHLEWSLLKMGPICGEKNQFTSSQEVELNGWLNLDSCDRRATDVLNQFAC